MKGAISSSGSTLAQAASAASVRRMDSGCATWMTRDDVVTLKLRHTWPCTCTSA